MALNPKQKRVNWFLALASLTLIGLGGLLFAFNGPIQDFLGRVTARDLKGARKSNRLPFRVMAVSGEFEYRKKGSVKWVKGSSGDIILDDVEINVKSGRVMLSGENEVLFELGDQAYASLETRREEEKNTFEADVRIFSGSALAFVNVKDSQSEVRIKTRHNTYRATRSVLSVKTDRPGDIVTLFSGNARGLRERFEKAGRSNVTKSKKTFVPLNQIDLSLQERHSVADIVKQARKSRETRKLAKIKIKRTVASETRFLRMCILDFAQSAEAKDIDEWIPYFIEPFELDADSLDHNGVRSRFQNAVRFAERIRIAMESGDIQINVRLKDDTAVAVVHANIQARKIGDQENRKREREITARLFFVYDENTWKVRRAVRLRDKLIR